MRQQKAVRGKRRLRGNTIYAILAGVCFFLLFAFWGALSPPSSAPDDTVHLPLIWCASGESDVCERNPDTSGILVPETVAGVCTIQRNLVSAACTYQFSGTLVSPTVLRNIGQDVNLEGLRPFHRFLGTLVGPSVERSVFAMRTVNALLAAALLAAALASSAPALRRSVALVWVGCLVPTGLFFIPSTNPSSWAIVGIAVFWVFLHSVLTIPSLASRRGVTAVLGAVVAAFMAATSRVEGSLYIFVSVVVVAILLGNRLTRHPLRLLVIATGLIAALVLGALSAMSTRVPRIFSELLKGGTDTPSEPANVAQGLNPLLNHLLELPAFLGSLFGVSHSYGWPTSFSSGLGWVDVDVPSLTAVSVLLVVGGLSLWGIGGMSWRRAIALVVVAASIVLVVMIPLVNANFGGSVTVQPRYVLPLVLLLLGLAFMRQTSRQSELGIAQLSLMGVLVVLANSVAMLSVVRRYSNGESVPYLRLELIPSWWWSGSPIGPVGVWLAGTSVSVVAVALLLLFASQKLCEGEFVVRKRYQ